METVLHLTAPNDRNGNPQGLFVVVDGGIVKNVIEEGFIGDQAWRKLYPNAIPVAWRFQISPTEFRRWWGIGSELSAE